MCLVYKNKTHRKEKVGKKRFMFYLLVGEYIFIFKESESLYGEEIFKRKSRNERLER